MMPVDATSGKYVCHCFSQYDSGYLSSVLRNKKNPSTINKGGKKAESFVWK